MNVQIKVQPIIEIRFRLNVRSARLSYPCRSVDVRLDSSKKETTEMSRFTFRLAIASLAFTVGVAATALCSCGLRLLSLTSDGPA